MTGIGTKEDDTNSFVALLNITTTTEPVRRLAGTQTPHIRQPIAATNFSAMPFYMARLGWHLENKGNPIAFKQATTLPHEKTPDNLQPAVFYLTVMPSSMAGLEHKEDNGNPNIDLFHSEESVMTLPLPGGKLKHSRVPIPSLKMNAAPSPMAQLVNDEDEGDSPVALLGFILMAALPMCNQTQHMSLPVVSYLIVTPSSLVNLVKEEDKGNPLFALFEVKLMAATTLHVHTQHICPPLVLSSTLMPSFLVPLGNEKDKDNVALFHPGLLNH